MEFLNKIIDSLPIGTFILGFLVFFMTFIEFKEKPTGIKFLNKLGVRWNKFSSILNPWKKNRKLQEDMSLYFKKIDKLEENNKGLEQKIIKKIKSGIENSEHHIYKNLDDMLDFIENSEEKLKVNEKLTDKRAINFSLLLKLVSSLIDRIDSISNELGLFHKCPSCERDYFLYFHGDYSLCPWCGKKDQKSDAQRAHNFELNLFSKFPTKKP